MQIQTLIIFHIFALSGIYRLGDTSISLHTSIILLSSSDSVYIIYQAFLVYFPQQINTSNGPMSTFIHDLSGRVGIKFDKWSHDYHFLFSRDRRNPKFYFLTLHAFMYRFNRRLSPCWLTTEPVLNAPPVVCLVVTGYYLTNAPFTQ